MKGKADWPFLSGSSVYIGGTRISEEVFHDAHSASLFMRSITHDTLFTAKYSMDSFDEKKSLLDASQTAHESVEAEEAGCPIDPQRTRSAYRRSNLLRLLHTVYTIAITFLIVVLSVQSILQNRFDNSRRGVVELRSPFRESKQLTEYRTRGYRATH